MNTRSSELGNLSERSWGWSFMIGIIFVIAGVIGLSNPFLLSLTTALFIGVLVLGNGVTEFVWAFRVKGWGNTLGELLLAALSFIAGAYLLLFPGVGLMAVTWILGFLFVLDGAVRLSLGFQTCSARWSRFLLINGAITVVLGIFVLAKWPSSSIWLLGTLVGLKLLVNGLSVLALALTLRSFQLRFPRPNY